MKKHTTTVFLIICIVGNTPMRLLAVGNSKEATADKQSAKIESVLDKLESKYLDREAGPLTYDEQISKPAGVSVKPAETINLKKPSAIEAATPNQKMLQDIQVKINEYENQMDALEADARKMKSDLIENSATDNVVTIEATLKDAKRAGLQSLTARLDGSLLFSQVDASGMWIPTSLITLYNGPVQPGEHTLEIVAVLTKTQESGIPVAGWTPQQVSESYKVNVSTGKLRRQVTVELDTSSERSGKAVAQFREKDLAIEATPSSLEAK